MQTHVHLASSPLCFAVLWRRRAKELGHEGYSAMSHMHGSAKSGGHHGAAQGRAEETGAHK